MCVLLWCMPSSAQQTAPLKWAYHFETGFAASEGNSETLDVHASTDATLENERHRLKLDAAYYYGESEDIKVKNELNAGLLKEWLFPGTRWNLFVQSRYDANEFEPYDHRAAAAGGVGYKFVDLENIKLRGRTGAGAYKEYGSNDEDIHYEGLLGADLDWDISKGQKFHAEATYYPDFSDPGEYRILSAASWTAQLGSSKMLSLGFGVKDEYRSKVQDGYENNDLKLFGSLRVSLENDHSGLR